MRVCEAITDFKAAWPLVEPLIQRLHDKCGVCDPFEVYKALAEPRATLHPVQDETGEWGGFFILTTDHESGDLFVWAAVAFDGVDEERLLTAESLVEFAREHGFPGIRFSTNRLGWGKKAKSLGFDIVNVVYRRDV